MDSPLMNVKACLVMALVILFYGCNNANAPQYLTPLINSISFEEVGDTIACRRGIEDAVKDYQAGELGLYFYGLPHPEFNTWIRLMQEEYDLKVKGGGDISEPEGKCYNKLMYELIELKFGKNAFERIDTKLDSLYKLDLGDRDVRFKGGEEGLIQYIYCNISDTLLKEDSVAPLVVVSLFIDEQGKIEESEILFRKNIEQNEALYDEAVKQLVENMPNWLPSVQNKVAVKQKFTVPIRFSRKIKKSNCG
jgi:hypothetical protein